MNGWIGVDLDGTLFTYHKWVGWNVFGEPIKPMVDRVRQWLKDGVEVRIVTARVGLPVCVSDRKNIYDGEPDNSCRVTGTKFSDAMMVAAIQQHLVKNGLPPLPVQCYKDINMIEFWDDRAVQVVPNTGRTLAEEHQAVLTALQAAGPGRGDIDV